MKILFLMIYNLVLGPDQRTMTLNTILCIDWIAQHFDMHHDPLSFADLCKCIFHCKIILSIKFCNCL